MGLVALLIRILLVCVLSMWAAQAGAQSVTYYTLTIDMQGPFFPRYPPGMTDLGLVVSNPPVINCFPMCRASFPAGTTLTLTGRSINGFIFGEWKGACSGTTQCVVTMNADKVVTAVYPFLPLPEGPNVFSLGVNVKGAGSVTSDPAGINCGSACLAGYPQYEKVVLTPATPTGWTFTGWSGDCSGITSPTTWPISKQCVLTIDDHKSVTATFVSDALPLDVTVIGTGLVTSTPPGINCGGTCHVNFPNGTTVTLTPIGAIGATFAGWTGACSGTGTCSMAMTAEKTVSATFTSDVARVNLNGSVFHAGQRLVYSADFSPAGSLFVLDVYLGVLLSDGATFLSFVQSPGGGSISTVIGASPVPYVKSALLTHTTVSVVYDVNGTEPRGTYTTYAAVVVAGTNPAIATNRLGLSARSFQLGP